MIYVFNRDDVNLENYLEWFEIDEDDDLLIILLGYLICVKYEVYLFCYGCVLCNNGSQRFFVSGRMSNEEEYKEQVKRFKISFVINISYFVNKKYIMFGMNGFESIVDYWDCVVYIDIIYDIQFRVRRFR